jgi:hypothetical protein
LRFAVHLRLVEAANERGRNVANNNRGGIDTSISL